MCPVLCHAPVAVQTDTVAADRMLSDPELRARTSRLDLTKLAVIPETGPVGMVFMNGYSNCMRKPGDTGCVHHTKGSAEYQANKILLQGAWPN